MMREFNAGKFVVEIADPHPCWIRIKRNGQELYGIHHGELADLEHCIRRARAEARRTLGNYAHEVD